MFLQKKMTISSCLALESRGKIVKICQDVLNHRNYNCNGEKLELDGYFGPQTESAVKQFQTDHGRQPTGQLTFEDIEVLLNIVNITLDCAASSEQENSYIKPVCPTVSRQLPELSNLENYVSQSRIIRLGMFSLLTIVLIFTIGGVINNNYTLEIGIKDFLELFATPELKKEPERKSSFQ